MSSDFRVQQFEYIVSPTSETEFIDIPIRVDPSRTRIMIGSPGMDMVALGASDSDSVYSRDSRFLLFVLNESQLLLITSKVMQWPAILSFCLLEYIGPPGGPNEFQVSRNINTFSGTSVDIRASVGITNHESQKLTSLAIGCKETGDGQTGYFRDDLSPKVIQTYNPNLNARIAHFISCADENSLSRQVSWEATNWIGSNWSIVRPPPGLLGVANQIDVMPFQTDGGHVYTIDDVGSWSNTFIEAQRTAPTPPAVSDNQAMSVVHPYPRPNPLTTSVRAYQRPGNVTTANGANSTTFAAISNPDIKVLHYGQFTGILESPTPQINLSTPDRRWEFAFRDDIGSVVIDGPPNTVVPTIHGTRGPGTNGYAELTVSYNNDGKEVVYRRAVKRGGGFNDYLQVIQFGLEPEGPSALLGSLVEKPRITVVFEA
jgi:hypothetical protein